MILILIFIVGACIGSFLNVVIYRVPNERSLLPSSACPSCGRGIKPWHNVPIVGWLILGGKCANCKSPISWRYPAIELLTAVLFCIVYLQFGLVPYLGVALAFTAAMTALVFIDADHMILPNVITYPLFIAALIVRVVFPAVFDHSFSDMTVAPISYLSGWPSWAVSLAGAIFGALVGGGSLWLIGAIWKAPRRRCNGSRRCKAASWDRSSIRLAAYASDDIHRCVYRSGRRDRDAVAAKGKGSPGSNSVRHILRDRFLHFDALRRSHYRLVFVAILITRDILCTR